jgi:hypothetical protein
LSGAETVRAGDWRHASVDDAAIQKSLRHTVGAIEAFTDQFCVERLDGSE